MCKIAALSAMFAFANNGNMAAKGNWAVLKLIWPLGVLLSCAGLAACSAPHVGLVTAIAPASAYVAMGSSYASGPGVTTSADQPPTRCARSNDNYAHLLARRMNLQLTDVTCSGAKTEHVFGPWKELPPQVDALNADTKLVTLTIGGNDVGYFGMLWSASCGTEPPPVGARGIECPLPPAQEDAWIKVDAGLRRIAAEVRRRAPYARLVFVDYVSVLPAKGTCANAPMSRDQARAIKAAADRLAQLTARVAAETGSELVKASTVSEPHNVCSSDPWITGFKSPVAARNFVPFHPNQKGMVGVADALERQLKTAMK